MANASYIYINGKIAINITDTGLSYEKFQNVCKIVLKECGDPILYWENGNVDWDDVGDFPAIAVDFKGNPVYWPNYRETLIKVRDLFAQYGLPKTSAEFYIGDYSNQDPDYMRYRLGFEGEGVLEHAYPTFPDGEEW